MAGMGLIGVRDRTFATFEQASVGSCIPSPDRMLAPESSSLFSVSRIRLDDLNLNLLEVANSS
jgi:hypothetical protein